LSANRRQQALKLCLNVPVAAAGRMGNCFVLMCDMLADTLLEHWMPEAILLPTIGVGCSPRPGTNLLQRVREAVDPPNLDVCRLRRTYASMNAAAGVVMKNYARLYGAFDHIHNCGYLYAGRAYKAQPYPQRFNGFYIQLLDLLRSATAK